MNYKINLFWYSKYNSQKPYPVFSKSKLRQILHKEKENYGDLLSKYIVEKISKKRTLWYRPRAEKKTNLFAIGSILNFCDSESIVWGSGIIDKKHDVGKGDFRAVRGPLTRRRLLELGYECPEVYGDPGLLLPHFYKPKIKPVCKLGIVPHIVDYQKIKSQYSNISGVKIINLNTVDVEKTTNDILSCEKIIYSSLHGLIVPHAYGIPAVWVKFSDQLQGDNVKFTDYFNSIGLENYEGETISSGFVDKELLALFEKYETLPKSGIIQNLIKGLIKSFPDDILKLETKK